MIAKYSRHTLDGQVFVVDDFDRVVQYEHGRLISSPPEHIMITGPVSEKDIKFQRTLIFDNGVLSNDLVLMHAQFPNGYKIEISRIGRGYIGREFAYSVKYWTSTGDSDIFCLIHSLTDLLGLFDFMRAKEDVPSDVESDSGGDEIVLQPVLS